MTDFKTLADLVGHHVRTRPHAIALTFEAGPALPEQQRSFLQLHENGLALALALQGLGVRCGDAVALVMANHPEFVEAMVAAARIGVVLVPIDARAQGDRLAALIDRTHCVGVIAADYAATAVAQIRPRCTSLRWTLCVASGELAEDAPRACEALDYAQLVARHMQTDVPVAHFAPVDPDGPMQILFTSGTTGEPKGIVITHRRFLDTAALAASAFGYASDDRLYSGLSLTHANAQLVTLGAALMLGIPCVVSRRFTKSRLWEIVRRHQCTAFTLLGGMTTAVYCEPPSPGDREHAVRFVVAAGMPQAIWRDFEQRFGVHVLEFYGTAEGGLTVNPFGKGPVGSIGRPHPAFSIRIVTEDGRDAPAGTPGELAFRPASGAPYGIAYFQDPEASQRKGQGGWLWTGDIVRSDADGWLYFEHRRGHGIRRNGEFIDPALIEKAIADTGLVRDAFVFGIAAASGAPGERDVVAAIVPDRIDLDPSALHARLRETLSKNAVPGTLMVVDAIPKTVSEKPLARVLEEWLRDGTAATVFEAPPVDPKQLSRVSLSREQCALETPHQTTSITAGSTRS
ncbi:crotonobetaine/carnitine-CoA ligase [Variovorax boronicumulans]|uniref:Crotonobetaine/carnitine-CoA ligase n=1 Tax=Variovorax boronicumulans TaxID=436515 RepID=A0AAW8DU37_9BURK|nr:AMP-binding protein [Variovorax boronicumulans]MDP9877842.1 crotonobetaine/carnitine-CoA ligase [Variovorax boronicumulans]MDP9923126.1 crotonobetaine/carnitine-CoA ligase [Variovorax boronicumulans]